MEQGSVRTQNEECTVEVGTSVDLFFLLDVLFSLSRSLSLSVL